MIHNSYRLSESLYVWDSTLRWNYSQTIIRRSMIKQKERIRMWNDIYEVIALICKMIDSPDYLWLNSSITILFYRQLNSQRSFWIRAFTLVWASIWIQLNMRSLKLESKRAKRRIYSNTWNDHYHWSSKH